MNNLLRAATGLAVASLVATPLAGCSGNTSALPGVPSVAAHAMGSAAIEPDARTRKGKLLFVSDNENNRILVYDAASQTQNPPPIRTITNGISLPNGIAVDKSGNLYVANLYTSTVTVYAPNASSPKMTISSGLISPFDVKVDGFGNVYVANNTGSGPEYINEYPAGSSSPSSTWYVPTTGMTISGIALLNPLQQGETSIYALAFDGNPSYGYTGTALSCYPGNPTCVSLGVTFGETGGITVAQSPGGSKPFEWLAVDQYVPGVDIFTQGQPNRQIVTGGTPEFLTLNATGKDLFVADSFYGRVDEYKFPAGEQINTFSASGALYGVATSPSGTFH